MSDEIFKISKNPLRAKSLIVMAKERLEDINNESKPYKIIEQYYEVIKELITALMYSEGFKTLSHKMLVFYLEKNYSIFYKSEIMLIDELRILRNSILYYGEKVEKEFLLNHKSSIDSIIDKLFNVAEKNIN
jgi:hypothetical protein